MAVQIPGQKKSNASLIGLVMHRILLAIIDASYAVTVLLDLKIGAISNHYSQTFHDFLTARIRSIYISSFYTRI